MKKNTIKYFIALSFLFVSVALIAQTRDSVINMESQFEGERRLFLRDANKLSTVPLIKEQVIDMTTIRYSTLPTRKTVTIEPKPILAAKINVEEKLPRLYRGYIRAGFGTFETVPVDFYFMDGRSKKGTYGIHYKLLRSSGLSLGDGDSIPDRFSDNRLEIWGRRFLNKHILEGNVNWERNVSHWYGFDNRQFTSEDLFMDSLRQRLNTFGGRLSYATFERDSSELNYKFDLAVRNTKDLFDGSETNFDWVATASQLINTELISGEVGINYNTFSFIGPNIGRFGVPIMDEEDIKARSWDNAVIRIIPTVQTIWKDLRAKVGAGLYFEGRGDTPAHLYPLAELSYSMFKGLIVPYAGVRGSVEPTTYLGLYRENPFIQTFPDLRNRNNKLELYGGIGGAVSKTVSFSAGVNYNSWENFAYFVNDSLYLSDSTNILYRSVGNRFTIIYDNLRALNIHGEMAIYSGEKWKANIRGDWFNYTLGNEVHAWHQPNLKFTASGQYKLRDKFTVGLDIFYIGSRWAKSLVPVEGVEAQSDGSYHFKLDGFTDANINVEYKYNKRLSAWVQFNNTLALRYQRWSGYDVQRFLAMMGATYAF